MTNKTRLYLMSAALVLSIGAANPSFAAPQFKNQDEIGGQVQEMVESGAYKSANILYGMGEVLLTTIAPDGKKTETIYKTDESGNLSVFFTRTTTADPEELKAEGFDEEKVDRTIAEDFPFEEGEEPEPRVNLNDDGEGPDDDGDDDTGSESSQESSGDSGE